MLAQPEMSPRVARYNAEQVKNFAEFPYHTEHIGSFDPRTSIQRIRQREGKECFSVDIGATKAEFQAYRVAGGQVLKSYGPRIIKSTDGAGYFDYFERNALLPRSNNWPVAISTAGVLHDTVLTDASNMHSFLNDFNNSHYEGDFAKLFANDQDGSTIPPFVMNDCVAAAFGGSLHMEQNKIAHTKNTITVINGTGLSATVLINGQLIKVEAGHTPLDDGLNPLKIKTSCGSTTCKNTTGICAKSVTSGSGMAATYLKAMQDRSPVEHSIKAVDMAKFAKEGDATALGILRNSADVVAHLYLGLVERFKLNDSDELPTLVCHGGVFRNEDYRASLEEYLKEYTKHAPKVYFTSDFMTNICIYGAASAHFAR